MMASEIAARSRRTLGAHGSVEIVRGRSASCNGSVFTAQIAFPITSAAMANAAIASMRQEGHCGVADHNMAAFRIRGKRALEKWSDDDGEARGGSRILGTLTKAGATNVAVMVSRVYGGVNIGKRRFELIAERTSALLDALGHQPGVGIAHAWGEGHALGGGAVAAELYSSQGAAHASSSSSGGTSAGPKRKRTGGGSTSRADEEEEDARRRAAQREAAALAAERRMQSSNGAPPPRGRAPE